MFEKTRAITIGVSITLLFLLSGLIAGYFYGRATKENELDNQQSEQITKRTIINRINEQYFVVTRTVYQDEMVEISIDQNSDWTDILWGKKITARGVVRSDVGVDLTKLEQDQIEINHERKQIRITLPDATILDSSIYGDIQVESSSGIITSFQNLFKKGQSDHNRATEELIRDSQNAITADFELMSEAKKESGKVVELIVEDLGYQVVIE